MKNHIFLINTLMVLLFVLTTSQQCQDKVNCVNGKCFSITKYKSNLDAALLNKCVGYTYAIYFNGKLERVGAGGKEVLPIDGKDVNMTISSRMHIASMSKTITAVTILKLLQDKGLSIDAKIINYLPNDWTKGVNIERITFKQLLTHNSGIRYHTTTIGSCNSLGSDTDNYKFLRCLIANGVNADSINVTEYCNHNFSLFKVIMPKLAGFEHHVEPDAFNPFGVFGEGNHVFTANKYREIVKSKLHFGEGIDCIGNDLRYYKFPHPDHLLGVSFGDLSAQAGAYGWYMSSVEYGNFINSLYKKEILSEQWLNTMLINKLGCYGSDRNWHNGGWDIFWNNADGTHSEGHFTGCWYKFENGLICVLEVNSSVTPDVTLIVQDSYRNAFD
jgi:CubicO group peptidase (beta-lactamase class C family)